MLFLPKIVPKLIMLNLSKDQLQETKFNWLKSMKDKLQENTQEYANMTKIKMSPKRGSVHLLPLETFHTMLKRKKKKSFSINSADDRYVIIKYN